MKINWFMVLFSILMFLVGMVLGISMGTYALIDRLAYGLSGSTLIVNFNETKLVEEMNKTIITSRISELKGEPQA